MRTTCETVTDTRRILAVWAGYGTLMASERRRRHARRVAILRAIAESPEIERMARYPRPRRLPSRALRTRDARYPYTLVPSINSDTRIALGLPWDAALTDDGRLATPARTAARWPLSHVLILRRPVESWIGSCASLCSPIPATRPTSQPAWAARPGLLSRSPRSRSCAGC